MSGGSNSGVNGGCDPGQAAVAAAAAIERDLRLGFSHQQQQQRDLMALAAANSAAVAARHPLAAALAAYP